MIDEKTFELLGKQDWELIILKLTLYTKDRFWISHKEDTPQNLAKGLQPADIALKAINLIYTGERQWNSEENPDLLKFLKYSVIDSLISSYLKSKERLTTNKIEQNELNDEDEEDIGLAYDVLDNDINIEAELNAKNCLQEMRKALEEDQEGLLIFDELIVGNKPGDIAKVLGLPIEDIRNILKRVRRKTIKFIPVLSSN